MRKSEACHLDRDQVDLRAGVLIITDSKFGNYAEGAVMPSPVTAGVAVGPAARNSSA